MQLRLNWLSWKKRQAKTDSQRLISPILYWWRSASEISGQCPEARSRQEQ